MRISEIFYSIQGEGKLAGTPSLFIRTSGCNLRCTWCDTPYTSWEPEGKNLDVEQVLQCATAYRTSHAVVTGGEPMIAPDMVQLTRRLKKEGYHITIETAATVWEEVAFDLASLSPKLAHSTPPARRGDPWSDRHEQTRLNPAVIRRFMDAGDYQLKFVLENPGDMEEIDGLLARIRPYETSNVLLMPQGVTRQELAARSGWIADLCKQRGFRYCPRLQIDLYGHVRGT